MKAVIRVIVNFLASRTNRHLLYIAVIAIFALVDFLVLDLARRTFVFYNISSGNVVVEGRMLRRSRSRETDITRYTNEVLLGPAALDLRPLFSRGTRLTSLLYRDGVVYANFSEDAALPPSEGGTALESFRTLHTGILRNFSYVRDVRFFIDGQAAFAGEFRQ